MKDPKLYRVVRPVLAFLFKLIYRPTTVGAENIPKEGKIVLAGNHTHVLNCFSVGLATKRCVRFIAKAELMKGIGKGVKSFKDGVKGIEDEINADVTKDEKKEEKK